MAIREGRWDCQYCGTRGILGRHKTCPICSSGRPQGTKFYLPPDSEEITDVEQVGYAQKGPDWICEFCGSSNPADLQTCNTCFAQRRRGGPTQEVKTYSPDQVPTSGDMTFEPTGQASADTDAASLLDLADWEEQIGRLPRRLLLIGGLLLLLVCGTFVALTGRQLINREIEARVAGYEWTRAVDIEIFRTVKEEDWSIPPGGRQLNQVQAVHHYDQILAGYETRSREVPEQVYVGDRSYTCGVRDLGNGYFEDVICSEPVYETRFRTETYQEPIYNQVPVYQTYYTYEIDKWVVDHTESASGRNRQPYWPQINLADHEREGQKKESYWVVFRDDEGASFRLEFPLEKWSQFHEGDTFKLKLDAQGEALELAN